MAADRGERAKLRVVVDRTSESSDSDASNAESSSSGSDGSSGSGSSRSSSGSSNNSDSGSSSSEDDSPKKNSRNERSRPTVADDVLIVEEVEEKPKQPVRSPINTIKGLVSKIYELKDDLNYTVCRY